MPSRAPDLRTRIVQAAAQLLAEGGREAVSTRAVSAAAGVQAPAIYRQFGDMRGLLHAAAHEVLAGYVRAKASRKPIDDPLEELRRGWDLHVGFGLANPAAYALVYGEAAEAAREPASVDGYAMLLALVGRIATAGRLRMGVDEAARLIHAGASGVTLTLIASPEERRDATLSETMRELVIAAIVGGRAASSSSSSHAHARLTTRAVALRAVLDEAEGTLTAPERALMDEWLDRLAKAPARPARSRTR